MLWRLIEANRGLLEKATQRDLPSESRLDHLVQERTPFLSLHDVYRNVSLSVDAANEAVTIICKALGLPRSVAVGFDTSSVLDVTQSTGSSLDCLAAARWGQRSKEEVQFRHMNAKAGVVEVWRLCPYCSPLPGDPDLVVVRRAGVSSLDVHQGSCTVIRPSDVVVKEQPDLAAMDLGCQVEIEVKGSLMSVDRQSYYVMSSGHQLLSDMVRTIRDDRGELCVGLVSDHFHPPCKICSRLTG